MLLLLSLLLSSLLLMGLLLIGGRRLSHVDHDDDAQLDNDMRAEGVRAGMKAVVSRGRWTLRAALGYFNGRDATGAALLVPDPERADLVREAFRLAAKGKTITEITDRMKGLGLLTRTPTSRLRPSWLQPRSSWRSSERWLWMPGRLGRRTPGSLPRTWTAA